MLQKLAGRARVFDCKIRARQRSTKRKSSFWFLGKSGCFPTEADTSAFLPVLAAVELKNKLFRFLVAILLDAGGWLLASAVAGTISSSMTDNRNVPGGGI